MTSVITAVGLRKAYGNQTVLDGIDLDIAAGTVFALLGPNGAGKTTTVHILSTLVRPDAGTINIESGMFTGAFTKLRENQNISSFGKFDFDYANIKGQPGGVVSADTISFTLTASGLTASQFTSFALHFCTASGTNCGPKTGFAEGEPAFSTPEPGTMVLLGTGFLGLVGVGRRKLFHR